MYQGTELHQLYDPSQGGHYPKPIQWQLNKKQKHVDHHKQNPHWHKLVMLMQHCRQVILTTLLTLSIPLSSLLDRAVQALPYHCRENSTVRCVVAPSQCRENSTEKSLAFERLYLFCLAPSVVRFYIDGLLVYQALQWFVLYRGSPWFSEKSTFEDFTLLFFWDKNHHHVSSLHEGFGLYVCL